MIEIISNNERFKIDSLFNIMYKLSWTDLSLMSIGLEGEQSVASCLLPALGETMVILIGLRGLQASSSV